MVHECSALLNSISSFKSLIEFGILIAARDIIKRSKCALGLFNTRRPAPYSDSLSTCTINACVDQDIAHGRSDSQRRLSSSSRRRGLQRNRHGFAGVELRRIPISDTAVLCVSSAKHREDVGYRCGQNHSRPTFCSPNISWMPAQLCYYFESLLTTKNP